MDPSSSPFLGQDKPPFVQGVASSFACCRLSPVQARRDSLLLRLKCQDSFVTVREQSHRIVGRHEVISLESATFAFKPTMGMPPCERNSKTSRRRN